MKITCKNFGLIKNAEITINGLTIIAGENDTGKSTISKLLFMLVKVLNKEVIERYARRLKSDKVSMNVSQFRHFLREEENYEAILERKDYYKYLVRKIQAPPTMRILSINLKKMVEEDIQGDDLRYKLNELKKHIVLSCFDEEDREIISTQMGDIQEDLRLNDLFEKIKNILEKPYPYEDAAKAVLNKYLSSMFMDDINNKFIEDDSLISALEGENIVLNATIKNNKVDTHQIIEEMPIKDVTLVESPLVLQYSTLFEKAKTTLDVTTEDVIFGHQETIVNVYVKDLVNKIKTPFSLWDLDEWFNTKTQVLDEKIASIDEYIRDVIDGVVEYNENDDCFVYNKKGKNINISNTASGVKAFGMLQLLFNKGFLKEDTMLILDEPEVNVHPKWQIKYAELLVKLAKYNKIKIVLTSHSPYFIEALQVYAKREKFLDNTTFYLAEKNTDGITSNIKDVKNDLEKIFQDLVEPLEKLKDIEEDDLLDEIDDL